MTRARDIANLVDSNGDIVAGALDNVPASNDASALTTGTLDAARLPSSGISASAVDAGILAKAQLPADQILQVIYGGNNYGVTAFPQSSAYTPFWSASITPSSTSSKILILGSMEVELNGGNYPSLLLQCRRGTTTSVHGHSIRGYEGAENNHSIFQNIEAWIDAPLTTSAVTYYFYGANSSGSTYTGTYGGRANAYNGSYAWLIELKG